MSQNESSSVVSQVLYRYRYIRRAPPKSTSEQSVPLPPDSTLGVTCVLRHV